MTTAKVETDLHLAKACEMFKVLPQEVTKEQRDAAKRENFFCFYDMPFGRKPSTFGDYNKAKQNKG